VTFWPRLGASGRPRTRDFIKQLQMNDPTVFFGDHFGSELEMRVVARLRKKTLLFLVLHQERLSVGQGVKKGSGLPTDAKLPERNQSGTTTSPAANNKPDVKNLRLKNESGNNNIR
jgi:hypothetical protein